MAAGIAYMDYFLLLGVKIRTLSIFFKIDK